MTKWIAVLAGAIALAGCHKKQPITDVSLSPTVSIDVTNNLSAPDQVTVFIVGQYGGRQVLGTVSPGQKKTYTYKPTTATDKFSLVAQGTAGRQTPSQLFTLINVTSLSWDLRSNTIQFYEQ